MADDTIFEVDGRKYINPQTELNERLQFIDTLRDTTAGNTAQIQRDTYNLGSPVTSNIGGLSGTERQWKAQYQTPQLESQVANLRQTAQANALTQAMQNITNYETNLLKQAWRGYYKRKKEQEDADRAAGKNGNINYNYTPEGMPAGTVRSNAPGTSSVWAGQYDSAGNPIVGVYDTKKAFSDKADPTALYSSTGEKGTSTSADWPTWDTVMSNLAVFNPFTSSVVLSAGAINSLFRKWLGK